MTKIMISSLLQLGELGPRLEDYLGQRWLFSSPLSPHSTRPHSGQNYQARAPRALGLLLADGAPTVGGGKTF